MTSRTPGSNEKSELELRANAALRSARANRHLPEGVTFALLAIAYELRSLRGLLEAKR